MTPEFWNNIYQSKNENEFSWFQDFPEKSLEIIQELNLDKNDKIIDIGGGDSHLVDCLLKKNYCNVSVLDISQISLNKLKKRLDVDGNNVEFITSDILHFKPNQKYKIWHDRATFHFLTSSEQIQKYIDIASNSVEVGGYLIVSTFSKSGPEKGSGLKITQYSEDDLNNLFVRFFQKIKCFEHTHKTPWGASQDFVYCLFKRI